MFLDSVSIYCKFFYTQQNRQNVFSFYADAYYKLDISYKYANSPILRSQIEDGATVKRDTRHI